jgi:hypothetical protein
MRFRVIGRSEQTQTEVVRDVVCETRENVEALAELIGIQVERVELLPDSLGPEEPADVSSRPGPSRSSAVPEAVSPPAEFGPEGAPGGEDEEAEPATARRPAEFGAAPEAGLPAPLDDPLRALRRFLAWSMLAQIALVIGWLLYGSTTQRQTEKVGTWELGIQGIILAFPFAFALWRLLPKRVVNAYYLRSFRHDAATPAVRSSLSVALGRQFRLSGIRDPRRRSIKVIRYLSVFLFALRYATSKYMNLEAGADWKQRLWRSLGDARCAIIDVSELTAFVVQEIRMCYRCLGLGRMLFVCKAASLRDAGDCKAAIAQHLDLPSAESEIQLATWDATRAGRRAFEADVRRFADGLAAEPAGLRHDAYPLGGSPATIDDAPGPSDRWVWVELGLGLALAWGLSVAFKAAIRWTGPGSTWALFALIPLLGFALCEFWEFLVYLKNCAGLRERCLALLTLGFAWWWFGAVVFGDAVERVQTAIHRVVSGSNLKTIAIAMHNYEGHTNKPLLADGVLKWQPPVNADSPLLPPEERIRAKTPPPSRPPISWRVAILPYIDEPELFREYNTSEPWDSPNNIRLVERMPKIYAMPGVEKETSIAVAGFRFLARKLHAMPGAESGAKKKTPPGHTYYRVFVSSPTSRAQAAFTRGKSRSLEWFLSRASDAILVVEAAEAVPWTKPGDLEYDPTGPLPKLGGHFSGVFQAALVSGQVREFHSDLPEAELRDRITVIGGNQTVTAPEPANPAPSRPASTTVPPIAATRFFVTVNGRNSAPTPIGAGTPFHVTAVALDSPGNVDHSYPGTVHFSSSDGRATLPANYTFTSRDDGVQTFPVKLGTAGTQTITITDTATGSITGQASVTVTPGSLTQFTLTEPKSVTAGKFFRFVVTARDPYGNVASGYRGRVRITSSDENATLPINYTYLESDAGSHTFPIILSTKWQPFGPGRTDATTRYEIVTATDISTTSITGHVTISVAAAGADSPGINRFRPGKQQAEKSKSSRGLSKSYFTVEATDATADKAFLLTVMAKDADGNFAIDYQGTVTFTSSDAKAILPANYTFTAQDGGIHTFSVTLKTAGRKTVTVRDTMTSSIIGRATVPVSVDGPMFGN